MRKTVKFFLTGSFLTLFGIVKRCLRWWKWVKRLLLYNKTPSSKKFQEVSFDVNANSHLRKVFRESFIVLPSQIFEFLDAELFAKFPTFHYFQAWNSTTSDCLININIFQPKYAQLLNVPNWFKVFSRTTILGNADSPNEATSSGNFYFSKCIFFWFPSTVAFLWSWIKRTNNVEFFPPNFFLSLTRTSAIKSFWCFPFVTHFLYSEVCLLHTWIRINMKKIIKRSIC